MNKDQQQLIIAVVIAAVIAGSGGFWAGKRSAASTFPTDAQARFGQNRQMGGMNDAGRMRRGFGGVSGEILSKSDTSLTVKDRDGGSKIVIYGPSTPVMHMASGTQADLVVGGGVVVMGKANPDGSVTAESIQLRPSFPQVAQPAN